MSVSRSVIAAVCLAGGVIGAEAQVPPGQPDHRPSQSRFIDQRAREAVTALPEGRGQAPIARGTGGPGDAARAGSHGGPFAPDPYGTPSYGLAPDAPRGETFNLMPGAGPRQGYYENSGGYYATPDFSAPEPRVE